MKKRRTERYNPRKHRDRTDWKRVDALTDEDVDAAIADDPDAAPIATGKELARAEIVMPEPKEQISIRLDREVLDWFRNQGPGYQTRINAVLRAFMRIRRTRNRRQ